MRCGIKVIVYVAIIILAYILISEIAHSDIDLFKSNKIEEGVG